MALALKMFRLEERLDEQAAEMKRMAQTLAELREVSKENNHAVGRVAIAVAGSVVALGGLLLAGLSWLTEMVKGK